VWGLLSHTPTEGPWAEVLAAWARQQGLDGVAVPWRQADGQTGQGRLSLQPVSAATTLPGATWLLTLQDTTAEHRASAEAERLATLLDTAQDFGRLGVWERKLPMGEGRWDRHMYRFFGMDPQGGVPDFDEVARRIHPDDHPGQRYRASTSAAGRYASRYRIVLPGQPTRHVQSQWEVKNGPDGQPALITGIMVDDTEVYELAESFHKTSAQLSLAVDLANIAIWRHDLKTQRIHCSERAWAMLGHSVSAQGIPLAEASALLHPDDRPLMAAASRQALRCGTPVDLEARYRSGPNEWRYVLTRRMVRRDEHGRAIEFVGVALDVSEQVQHTRRASEMAKRLEMAAAASNLGIWGRDPATRRAEWNAQMFAIVGRDPARGLPSRHEWIEEIIHPDDRATMRRAHAEMLASWGTTIEHQYRIVRPDGQVRWLINRSRHEAMNGQAMILGITIDVTERVLAEAAHVQERVLAEAARQDKLVAERESKAKSEFLARMSHELRTPLNAVLGFAQLLQLDGEQFNESQRYKLAHIRAAGDHLLSLINDVLDLSSLESGRFNVDLQAVPLGEVLGEALPLVESLAQVQGVSLHVGNVHEVVFGDRTRIRQVLINLLSNAIKYNRAQGEVHVSSAAEGEQVVLRVRDTGRGMSAQQLGQLFEPFNRLGMERETIQGTGIGLALVKALVERMGGRIEVRSEVGQGSLFEVYLPSSAHGVPHSPAAGLPLSAAPTPGGAPRGTVLYIEDNPINLILVEELVRGQAGLAIECAETGLAGVARAKALQPDLILIDIQLPDIDGFEVLQRLRQQVETAAIPCVALSANAMPEDIARALALGFDDYWTKPIDFTTFLTALDRLFPRP
jgi:PAS domain S-box-containing protein